MSKETRDRIAFRMQPETRRRIEQWYAADNCQSMNEFVEKAVNFYVDHLEIQDNQTLLPMAIQYAIDGRLRRMEDYKDNRFSFIELFNDETGTLIRSNVLEHGVETKQLPLMRSFPELIDIGIMGACNAGKSGLCRNAGVDCYQLGMLSHETNMSLDDYCSIIAQCRGRTFQIALGGAGDPNKH